MNEMKQIQIGKVVVNVGIGQVGEDVEKAKNLIEKITGKTAVKTESREASKTFGNREGLKIGAMTTLRGEEAMEFLEKVFTAVEEVEASQFDDAGNFGFGIGEYIDVSGIDYDADIGMMGFEVSVNLERPGYRIKRRDYRPSDIGDEHIVNREDAIEFVEQEFDVEVKDK
ncbi:MAG: 50S ribosomal protein L5 [Candidatus Nanohaloarchaea archaeon]